MLHWTFHLFIANAMKLYKIVIYFQQQCLFYVLLTHQWMMITEWHFVLQSTVSMCYLHRSNIQYRSCYMSVCPVFCLHDLFPKLNMFRLNLILRGLYQNLLVRFCVYMDSFNRNPTLHGAQIKCYHFHYESWYVTNIRAHKGL